MTKTGPRKAIGPEERLVITLVFLATGVCYRRLAFSFKIAHCTISHIVSETCIAIWKRLKPLHLLPPQSENDWLSIAKGFHEKWQLTHALGSNIIILLEALTIFKGVLTGNMFVWCSPQILAQFFTITKSSTV